MILTLKTSKHFLLYGCSVVAFLLFFPVLVLAQTGTTLSLSVSPTLYDMTADPGQIWQSSIRVINPNPYPLTVYLDTVNFEPNGESGQPRFLPLDDPATATSTLARWISLGSGEVTIPAEQTKELAFTISVPAGAPPGGHYAAVLVGTRPPEDNPNRNQLETSQIVTSLVFLRVTGSVFEEGSIRSFRTVERFLSTPETSFELRFENTGNVHLLPQGQIEIYNMWGQERGVIPINQAQLFGKVVQDSVRKFTYNWKGEWSVADIGRYRAVATVAYGLNDKQFATSDTAFWVIPWKPLLLVLGIIFGFIFFITTIIRWYIRRMLAMAGVSEATAGSRVARVSGATRTAKPLTQDMLDLRSQFRSNTTESGLLIGIIQTIKYRYRFFLGVVLALGFILLAYWFFSGAFMDSRGYEVEIVGPNETVTVTSEDVAYEAAKGAESPAGAADSPAASSTATSTESLAPKIQIVNRSGVPGAAAQLRLDLEAAGVVIDSLGTDLDTSEHNTVIVYEPSLAEQALALSQQIDNALLSAYAPDADIDYPIVIYVGREYADALQ